MTYLVPILATFAAEVSVDADTEDEAFAKVARGEWDSYLERELVDWGATGPPEEVQ